MSFGIKPYDFVQKVYYAQEKVVLDFWPSDDKYKEVLFEANLVLEELQNVEDWTWLRRQLVLGDVDGPPNSIPEFDLPEWVYKPSTLYHDGVRLHRLLHHHHHHCHHHHHHCRGCGGCSGDILQVGYISCPIASTGDVSWRKDRDWESHSVIHVPDLRLRAVVIGDTVTFNRPLLAYERHGRVAVMDVQQRIEQFHICTDACKGVKEDEPISYELDEHGEWRNPCREIEPVCLEVVPDPNYVVMATAARHAEGSPPAQSRIQTLQDNAQRILSAMRQNDAAATDSDYLDWDVPGYFEIV